MTDGVLYIGNKRYSSWSMRGWLAVRLAALDVDIRLIPFERPGPTKAIAALSPNGLVPFITVLFFLGLAGGNFAIFSLWLPEQYNTAMRATAFAFCTSFGRFLGAGANFAIAALIQWSGSLGYVIALTAIPFLLGLAIIPFATETRGKPLP